MATPRQFYKNVYFLSTDESLNNTTASVVITGGLSIQKNTNILGNLTVGSIKSIGLTTGNINFTGSLYQNSVPYVGSQWTGTNGTTLFYGSGGALVGINTSSPNYALDVNGNVRTLNITTSNINSSGLTTGNINFTGELYKNGSPYIGSQWSGTTGTLLYYGSGGASIGINTSTPSYTLDVNGNARTLGLTTGNVYSTGLTTGNINSSGLTTGNINSSGLTTGNINSSGLTTGNINSSGLTTGNINFTGNLSSNINSLVYLGNPTTGNARINIQDLSNNHISFYYLTNTTGSITCIGPNPGMYLNGGGGVSQLTLSSTGNVGINMSNPSAILDVSGTGRFINANNVSSGRGLELNYNPNTSVGNIYSYDRTNLLYNTLNLNDKMLINSSGNVSINSSTNSVGGYTLPYDVNGTFGTTGSISIPIIWANTLFNHVEIKVHYLMTAVGNVTLGGKDINNAAAPLSEVAETTIKYNNQVTPVYTNSGLISTSTETLGIDNQCVITIVKPTNTTIYGIRNHYRFDTVYCFSEVGTVRVYGMGHIDTGTLGSIQLTTSVGNIYGWYSARYTY